MTSILKNLYIDKLADIINKYNNTYHSTIKRKPVDIKPSTYHDFNGDHVRISKYENMFAKTYIPN